MEVKEIGVNNSINIKYEVIMMMTDLFFSMVLVLLKAIVVDIEVLKIIFDEW